MLLPQIITAGIEKLQCVVCCEVLSAKSVTSSNLKCHFDSKHLSFAAKETYYFRSKVNGFKKAELDTCGSCHKQNAAATGAPYLVTPRIARVMKPHTIAWIYCCQRPKYFLNYDWRKIHYPIEGNFLI